LAQKSRFAYTFSGTYKCQVDIWIKKRIKLILVEEVAIKDLKGFIFSSIVAKERWI
jgi:hypothetical protein